MHGKGGKGKGKSEKGKGTGGASRWGAGTHGKGKGVSTFEEADLWYGASTAQWPAHPEAKVDPWIAAAGPAATWPGTL